MRYSILLAVSAAVLLSSCVTRPKTYLAPDRTKVVATSKRLSAAIDRANETAARAEEKVQEAQASADRVAGHSASVLQLIRELKPLIASPASDPAELRAKFAELEKSADAQIAEEGVLSTAIVGARGEIGQLQLDQKKIVQERDQLVNVDQPALFKAGETLAKNATDERNARIAAEKQLVRQKIFGLFWKIGGAALVVTILVLAAAWWFGKLTFKFVK